MAQEQKPHFSHKDLEDIFKSLLEKEVCNKRPNINNRVLLDGRFFGHGLQWRPVEAEVLEISTCAYKVKILHQSPIFQDPIILWLHKALVLAVLPTKPDTVPKL